MRNGLHFALIGENVAYSKSPAIFEAIFRAVGRAGKFEIASVQQNDLRASLNQLVLEGVRGFAVTIPFKQTVLPILDDLDPVAQKLGAVNSIAVDETRLYGYNTDCYGFALPLAVDGKKNIGTSALIAGCGGAARAVAYALSKDLGVQDLTLLGRSVERLAECKRALEQNLERARVRTVVSGQDADMLNAPFDVIVNCTPLGGWRHQDATPFPAGVNFTPGKIYYDLNYNDNNRLVAAARDRGMIALDGSAMLVGQAIRSFAIWTDLQAPFDDIYRAVFGNRNGRPVT